MSSKLPIVDLTGAVVGTQNTIDFNQFPKFDPATQKPAHLRVFNDSGCGLDYVMKQSGDSDYIPAGGWATIELAPNDAQMLTTVNYLLPNPPVSKILPTYYAPGERVPPIPILGNSPVGVGGSVSTTSANNLSNEANSLATEVIDIGPTTFAKLIDIFNDHFIWSVLQSGVAHQVLKGLTSGNPLQIGQAGDIAEVLGQLLVDQCAKTGPTSPPTGTGTTTIYEFVIGPFKFVAVVQSGLKNTSASKFTMALPTAFTSTCWIVCGDTSGLELLSGANPINIDVINTTAAGSGSGVTSETALFTGNIGYAPVNNAGVDAPFDSLRFGAGNANTHTSICFIVGI